MLCGVAVFHAKRETRAPATPTIGVEDARDQPWEDATLGRRLTKVQRFMNLTAPAKGALGRRAHQWIFPLSVLEPYSPLFAQKSSWTTAW